MTKIQEVKAKIQETAGRIFSIQFVKRTTGEIRTMQARLGVTSHLKGGQPNYNADDHDLIRVFDVANGGYRSVPLESVKSITFQGEKSEF